jgi:hypothetical protein
MKIIGTTIFVLLLFFSFSAKSQQLPKKGAILVMKEKNFNVTPDKVTTANIQIIRSKSCRKTKFGGLSAGTPDGITINFEQDSENIDQYLMTVLANETASNESYTIIIKGIGDNAHKIRGTTVKVNLHQNQVVKSNQ